MRGETTVTVPDSAADPAAGARLAALLAYPGETLAVDLAAAEETLRAELPEAAEAVAQFSAAVLPLSPEEREELYTRTFDINPLCTLEIGWHLFGEEYHRGALLVRLRRELAQHGVPESAELPDHLVHVLPLLDRMPAGEGREFACACVFPALEKMRHGFAERSDNPYGCVLQAVALLLEFRFGSAGQD